MRKTLLSLISLLFVYGIAVAQDSAGVDSVRQVQAELTPAGEAADETQDAVTETAKTGKKTVYVFPIREDIMPAVARLTHNCLEEARNIEADYIIINMNTYGGLVDAADSVRTMLLNCQIPVFTFINNQAASAGALIALATDSIYMRPGASIGAATVVDQSGSDLPDKYQSFMRSMMRATAEAHGKIPVVDRRGDTTWVWRRDPQIAQAMVDPTISVAALPDTTKVLTFTPEEAVEWGYCEGIVSTIPELLSVAGIDDYELIEYEPTWLDKLLGILTNPTLQGIFIMLIIGGIYFELQTPGIGFPLVVAILGAVLYFAPLYMEGLIAHWELIVFVVGLILILIEIFVTPGFGVLGILGIVAVLVGLIFALIDTSLLRYIPTGELPISIVVRPIMIVLIAVALGTVLSIWLGNKFLKGRSRLRNKLVLATDMTAEEGYVARTADRGLVGREAVTFIPLRPTGKVTIDGQIYEAAGENATFIEKGIAVIVVRDEGGVLYCRPK